MNSVFVDTSAFLAWRRRTDQHHEAVAEQFELLFRDGVGLVTSNQVVGETWTFLRHRYDYRVALQLLDAIDASAVIEVVFVDEAADHVAFAWLRRFSGPAYSYVDATSFALMSSMGLTRVLTLDSDFASAGFEVLPG